MNWPLLGRIASAPIRPLIAVKLLVLVETCTIGFGPSPFHEVLNVTGPGAGAGLSAFAAWAAAARSWPAVWLSSWLSPAVRRLMNSRLR